MSWQVAWIVVGAVTGLAALTTALRTPARELPGVRSYWLFLPILMVWTGDALVGDARPVLERVGKGTIAALLWLSVAVVEWRRRAASARKNAGGSRRTLLTSRSRARD